MLLLPIFILVFAGSNIASAELEDIRELALANKYFAFNLQKNLNPKGNIFYSPLSIFIAVSMLYQGARNTTAEEIRQALSYDAAGLKDKNLEKFEELLSFIVSSTDEEYKLDIANAMASQKEYSVSEEYKKILEHFKAKLMVLDFANGTENAIQEINSYVSDKTEGKIYNFLESIDPSARVVIINACYFKSVWQVEFSANETTNEEFYNNGLNTVIIPMMNGNLYMFYVEEDSFKALKLPYKSGDVSMVLLLPKERNGLCQLERELTACKLDKIMSKMTNTSVFIAIPRFKLEYSNELNDPFMRMGMNIAFSDEANFTGISEEGGLKVSSIYHKAVVEVNEEGSEAAAATAVVVVVVSFPGPKIYSFRAEHPFLFFIIHEATGMILFFGRVTEL